MAQAEMLVQLDQEGDTLKGRYLIFSICDEMYGMEIRYITEIISIQPITEVPGVPAYVKGITNLRGKIIPIMDARVRFKKAIKEYDGKTCIIVIDTDDASVGLIVDSVAEVLTIRDDEIAPPPGLAKGGHMYIKGIGKAGGDVKLLLDCQKMLADEEAIILKSMA